VVFPDEYEQGDDCEQLDDEAIEDNLLNRPYSQHAEHHEGIDHRHAVGRAAVAATLAATLVAPGAVLAAEITEPDPVPIVQVIQLDDPPDNIQAAITDDDQDKSKSGLSFFKKLLLGFAVIVLLLLMFLVTRCAASILGIGAPVPGGTGAGDEGAYTISLTIDDSVARQIGQQLNPVVVSVTQQKSSTVLVENVEVGYGDPVEICKADPGEYMLVILDDPTASGNGVSSENGTSAALAYRIVPGSQSFTVKDSDVLLKCTVLAIEDAAADQESEQKAA